MKLFTLLLNFILICLLSFGGKVNGITTPCPSSSLTDDQLQKYLLPSNHPLTPILNHVIASLQADCFENFDTLVDNGLTIRNELMSIRPWSIMVAEHPLLKGYLIKKFPNCFDQSLQIDNMVRRIKGARDLANYIETYKLKYIVVPKKWLYRLPSKFSISTSSSYILIVEDMNICPGGYWGGETLEKYHKIKPPVLKELCQVLHDVLGCDFWPQNQPFTRTNQIAFIDTERMFWNPNASSLLAWSSFQKMLFYIDPDLVPYALNLWADFESTKAR